MITKIKSSKTAAFKLSMGILVTAALLMIFAFDKDDNLIQIQEKKVVNKPIEAAVSNQQNAKPTDEPVFMVVEQMPVFPGGDMALRRFIANEVKYPEDAKKAGIQGKVFVNFVVNKEGKVINPKIARGVSPSLDKEALRVVGILPTWTPGKQKGQNVAVSYTIPIQFKLK